MNTSGNFATSDGKIFKDEFEYIADSLGYKAPVEESKTPEVTSVSKADVGPPQEPTIPSETVPETKTEGGIINNIANARPWHGLLSDTNPFKRDIEDVKKVYDGITSLWPKLQGVVSGSIEPGTPEHTQAVFDIAANIVGLPAPVAGRMADGTLGSFAGVRSKTVNKTRLYEAQNMKSAGHTPEEIWDSTGTFQGADGRWRQEIPDQNAFLKIENFDSVRTGSSEPNISIPHYAENYKLKDIYDHPELYEAYPELKDVKVEPLTTKDGIAHYDPATNTIRMKPNLSQSEFKSILAHEIQHTVQRIEGFETGSAPTAYRSKELESAENFFREMKPEVERGIMQRTGMDQNTLDTVKEYLNKDPKDLMGFQSKFLETWHKKFPEDMARIDRIAESEFHLNNAAKDRYQKYHKVQGEVEARNVQERLNLTNEQREGYSPLRSQDVPYDQQTRSPWSSSASEMAGPVSDPMPKDYFNKVPQERRLSRTGISHPGYRFEVFDPTDGKIIRKDIQTRVGASRAQDRLDNQYGAYKYRVRQVLAKELTEEEIKFLKDNDINLPTRDRK